MKTSRLTPYLLSVLRIVAAALYVAHGTSKLFGVPGHPFHAPVPAMTLLFAAGVLDSFGMVMLIDALGTEFGIQIPGDDLRPENFYTVNAIAALVRGASE